MLKGNIHKPFFKYFNKILISHCKNYRMAFRNMQSLFYKSRGEFNGYNEGLNLISKLDMSIKNIYISKFTRQVILLNFLNKEQ